MPMTKFYLRTGTTPQYKQVLSGAVHDALVGVLGIPDDDKFHFFHELDAEDLIAAPVAFGLERRAQAVFIQMYFGARPVEVLQALYRSVVANLVERAGLETRDIYLNVVESPSANWWADGRRLDPATGFDERIAADKVPSTP